MNAADLDDLIASTRRLRTRFAVTAPRPWDATTAGAELTVQLGHLALCLLRRAGADVGDLSDPARPITDPGDELADVLLAGLSVAVLAGSALSEPAVAEGDGPARTSAVPVDPGGSSDWAVIAFLRVMVAAGALSEAGMIAAGHRHLPSGTPPGVGTACAVLLRTCEELAALLGLDPLAEFQRMDADATRFLDDWVVASDEEAP